jgi:hypothetical protein
MVMKPKITEWLDYKVEVKRVAELNRNTKNSFCEKWVVGVEAYIALLGGIARILFPDEVDMPKGERGKENFCAGSHQA